MAQLFQTYVVFESSLPRDHPLEGNMPVFESPLHRDPQLEGSMFNVMYNVVYLDSNV